MAIFNSFGNFKGIHKNINTLTRYNEPKVAQLKEIKRLRAEGKTYAEIAEELGITKSAVNKMMQNYGLQQRKGK